MKKIDWKSLLVCLAIPLAVGGLAGILIQPGMDAYAAANRPPLAPPAVVFPIVWSVLFLLMGVSCYLIVQSAAPAARRRQALRVYGLQLAVNFFWPLIFFRLQAYLAAFAWLVLLGILVAYMILLFWRIKKSAAWLQLPYFVWLLFAAYLNMGVYLLNA